jgi:hypothetical protein
VKASTIGIRTLADYSIWLKDCQHVACLSTDDWLKCTTSMVVFGRETEAGPVGHSVGLRGVVGNSFSREQWICPTLLGQCETLPRTGTTCRKRMSGIRELAPKVYVSCVSGFPCRLYIDSNHHDSRIWVTTYLWNIVINELWLCFTSYPIFMPKPSIFST